MKSFGVRYLTYNFEIDSRDLEKVVARYKMVAEGDVSTVDEEYWGMNGLCDYEYGDVDKVLVDGKSEGVVVLFG